MIKYLIFAIFLNCNVFNSAEKNNYLAPDNISTEEQLQSKKIIIDQMHKAFKEGHKDVTDLFKSETIFPTANNSTKQISIALAAIFYIKFWKLCVPATFVYNLINFNLKSKESKEETIQNIKSYLSPVKNFLESCKLTLNNKNNQQNPPALDDIKNFLITYKYDIISGIFGIAGLTLLILSIKKGFHSKANDSSPWSTFNKS